MDFDKITGPSVFDGFDCPQKLDSLELAKVDDSWFVRKASSCAEKNKTNQSEPSTEADDIFNSLSTIKEKENFVAISAVIMEASPGSKSNESSPQPRSPAAAASQTRAASPVAAAASTTTLLTEAAGPLATANRCQQRSKWETLRIQRERRYEQLRQQRKDSIFRHEQESAQLLRSAAVPKAQPIRHYKPIRIHRSDRPLTVAKSPDFALARRERHKPSQNPQE